MYHTEPIFKLLDVRHGETPADHWHRVIHCATAWSGTWLEARWQHMVHCHDRLVYCFPSNPGNGLLLNRLQNYWSATAWTHTPSESDTLQTTTSVCVCVYFFWWHTSLWDYCETCKLSTDWLKVGWTVGLKSLSAALSCLLYELVVFGRRISLTSLSEPVCSCFPSLWLLSLFALQIVGWASKTLFFLWLLCPVTRCLQCSDWQFSAVILTKDGMSIIKL